MINRKLRMGMVGGGSDAFIGAIHRLAANMDGQIELACGCFSINPEISVSSGKSYFLPDDRIYRNFEEMFEKEEIGILGGVYNIKNGQVDFFKNLTKRKKEDKWLANA